MTERQHNPEGHLKPTLAAPVLRGVLLALAVLGAVGCAAGWFASPRQFYHSYLVGHLFVLTVVLGMLFFVMLHYVVDAGWSTVVRRPAEQVLACLPVLALLFVPIVIGMLSNSPYSIYKWTFDRGYEGFSTADQMLLDWKQPFLSPWFFVLTVVVGFGAWWGLSLIFRGRSLRQDENGDPALTLSMRKWSAPGLIIYAFTFTAAAKLWIMSLDFHWYSTIFGVYVWSGAVVASLALLVLMVIGLGKGPLRGMISSDNLHDLGKLLFGFAVFWAYIKFSQYFLMWYANIPEETIWYLHRWMGTEEVPASWWWVSVLLPVGRFVLPFVVLMSAVPKRHPGVMAVVAVALLAVHYVDMYWMVMPELHRSGPALGWLWLDLSAVAFVGGVCGMVVVWAMSRAALYPVRDPRLHEALETDAHHAGVETPL
jgi:hypothetical protein